MQTVARATAAECLHASLQRFCRDTRERKMVKAFQKLSAGMHVSEIESANKNSEGFFDALERVVDTPSRSHPFAKGQTG